MEYEIVELEEKKMIGIPTKTNNSDADMMAKIGGLWGELYSGVYDKVENKVNQKRIGAYTSYESDADGDYTVAVGCEVSSTNETIDGTEYFTIPSGKYAKFTLHGNLHEIIGKFWKELWEMDLDRNYVFDFEEYQDFELDNTSIIVYIGIR